MKTVLMIAPYFLPRRRVGSLRPFRFAIHLRKYGWEPVILTLASPGERFSAIEKKLISDIRIIEIDPPFDRTTEKPVSKEPKPEKTGNDLAGQISAFIDRHTPVDTWIYLFMLRYLSILRTSKKVNPDLIWSTGDPWSGLWLGNKLSGDLDKPLITDFRDPWTLSRLNLRERSHFSLSIDRNTERKILENSEKVIFTSKIAVSEYREKLGLEQEKTGVIYNSYCRNLITNNPAEEVTMNFRDDKLNLLFLGEFRRLSPAEPVIQLLNDLKRMRPGLDQKLCIHSFGRLTQNDREMIKTSGLEDHFVVHSKVLPEQIYSVMQAADLLLLTTSSKRSNIIPAKLWDYLSSNRPILSITPNGEIEEIINKVSGGVHFYPNENREAAEFMIQCLESFGSDKPLIDVDPAKREISRRSFESEQTTAQLASCFDEVIADGH